MVIHEFVERVEFEDPKKVFAGTVPEHFEMLYCITISVAKIKMKQTIAKKIWLKGDSNQRPLSYKSSVLYHLSCPAP